jgi:periplasmic divalent cation tolerance protein
MDSASSPSSSSAVLVLTTWPADKDAGPFARQLVDERLAACVNLLPAMRSIYRWEGAIQEEPERQVVIKTTTGRLDALIARLKALHPYEVPECLMVPVQGGGADYLAWVAQSVTVPAE